MKGTEIITRERLVSYGACSDGMALFDKNHPDGQGEYQALLDEACAADHADFAEWLLDKVGATEDVLELDEVDDKERSIIFAGSIHIKKGAILKRLHAGWSIKAGWFIEAGGSIKAGGSIEAGWFIEAGESIKAGTDYGIYAGLRAKITDRENRAVKAKAKPDNLMCGEFVEA